MRWLALTLFALTSLVSFGLQTVAAQADDLAALWQETTDAFNAGEFTVEAYAVEGAIGEGIPCSALGTQTCTSHPCRFPKLLGHRGDASPVPRLRLLVRPSADANALGGSAARGTRVLGTGCVGTYTVPASGRPREHPLDATPSAAVSQWRAVRGLSCPAWLVHLQETEHDREGRMQ